MEKQFLHQFEMLDTHSSEAAQYQFGDPESDRYTPQELEIRNTIPEHERYEMTKYLFHNPVPMELLRKIGPDVLYGTFVSMRDGLPGEQEMWQRLAPLIALLREGTETGFELLRPLHFDDDPAFSQAVDEVLADSPLAQEIQERGFESIDEVRITNITVDHFEKTAITEIQEGGYVHVDLETTGIPIQLSGTIEVDSPLLAEAATTYTWHAEYRVQTDIQRQLLFAPKKLRQLGIQETISLADLQRPFGEMYLSMDCGEETADVGGQYSIRAAVTQNRPFTKQQQALLEKYGLDEMEAGDHYPTNVADRINKHIGGQIDLQLRQYIQQTFDLNKFLDREYFAAAYEATADVSQLRERELDELYGQAIAEGVIPEKLWYAGRNAQFFLEAVARDQRNISREELLILRQHKKDILPLLHNHRIVELGPGSAHNTAQLFNELLKAYDDDIDYQPIDQYSEMIAATSLTMSEDVAEPDRITTRAHVGDFHDLEIIVDAEKDNVFLMLGSTLGNFEQHEQVHLLQQVRKGMKEGEILIVGVQLKQDLKKIAKTYEGDKAEQFNRKIADDFNIPPDNIRYEVAADEERNQVTMKVVFNERTKVQHGAHAKWYEKDAEMITTFSHKYIPEEITELFSQSGFQIDDELQRKPPLGIRMFAGKPSYEVVVARAM